MCDTVALDHGQRTDNVVVDLTPEIVGVFNKGIKSTIKFNYGYHFNIIDKYVSDDNEPNVMHPVMFECVFPQDVSICVLQCPGEKEYYINNNGLLVDTLKFDIPTNVTSDVDTVRMDEIVPSMIISGNKLIFMNCMAVASLYKCNTDTHVLYEENRMYDAVGGGQMLITSCLRPGILNPISIMLLDIGVQPSAIQIPLSGKYKMKPLVKVETTRN